MKKIQFILSMFFIYTFIIRYKVHVAFTGKKPVTPFDGGIFDAVLKALMIEKRNKLILRIFRNNRGKDCKQAIILTVMYIKRFPVKWSDFDSFIVPASAYLDDNKVRLLLITADVAALLVLINDPATGWVFVYGKITNTLTNAKNWRDRRDILRNEIIFLMNKIEDGIRQEILTPEDRIALRLPPANHTHTPIIKMPVPPTLSIETIIHLQNILRLKNPLTPDSDAMPYGQHIILEYFIGDADIHDDAINFDNAKTVTTFLYGVAFDISNVGKTVYYRVCYENHRGKRSIWSATKSQVIA